jgi:hypothetical protein
LNGEFDGVVARGVNVAVDHDERDGEFGWVGFAQGFDILRWGAIFDWADFLQDGLEVVWDWGLHSSYGILFWCLDVEENEVLQTRQCL